VEQSLCTLIEDLDSPDPLGPGHRRILGVLLTRAENRRCLQGRAPIDTLSLVLVAIFAFTFLDERPSGREWAGIAMIASGVLLLAFKR